MAPRIDSFLRLVADQKASDLHFHSGSLPTIRMDGELLELPFRKLSAEETKKFLYEIMTPAQREQFEKKQELDFAHAIPDVGRFRVNAFVQSAGIAAVFRVIPKRVPTIAELALPRAVQRMASLKDGLVLISGPTGSGKTTTLAAMIHEINRTRQAHIITVEDPIEYVHTSEQSLVTQREVGSHTESFAAALRAALRESPDVLVVGELRDVETVMLALSAAETGVLVFGTLHTNSAAKCIDRLVDMVAEDMQGQVRSSLSMLLRGIVAQQLLRRTDGEGRVAVVEVLLPSFALAHLIREGKVHLVDQLIKSHEGDGSGNQSLDTVLGRLIQQGLLDLDEALKVATDPAACRRAAQLVEDG
jgi:twitching motility protein PilT